MVYNLDVGLFLDFKWFKRYSGSNMIAIYFQSYINPKKKKKIVTFKRK